MDTRRERKTSGESTATDSSDTASCRPYYLPETPAAFSSSQVVRSATPYTWYAPSSSSASLSRVGDYSQSPADLMDFRKSNEPCSSYNPSPRFPLSITVPTQSNSVSNSTPLNKSGEEKRRLSPSWSTPDPKQAKLTHVDKAVVFKEGKPGDRDLDELAGKICAKWQELGLYLGISQDKLDEIDANEKRRAYRMLLHWRNTTASATLYRDLYNALRHERVGLNNVAKEFCVTDSEASAKDIFDVKSCRSKLAEHYKETAMVPTSVWCRKRDVDIRQIYTRLSLVKEEQTPAGSSQSELSQYTDLFTANKNGVAPKRILVQGQTGIGKSTFVKKLAVDWAELDDATTGDRQKDILKKFELLVVVNLKEVSKCHSLKDVISRSSIFAREEKYLTDSLLNYIKNNEEKVLLVFDGYDEYGCGKYSQVYEIFTRGYLRNCCVLITTRISKADELRVSKVDMHAEITGFSEEDGQAFMSKMLGGKAQAEELRHHLVGKNLKDLAKVPLLLLFFCALWEKGKSKSFPERKTKLYVQIVQYVVDHNQGKDSPDHYGKVDDDFKEVLVEIGKVALECLLNKNHVFEDNQLPPAICPEKSRLIGLIQVTKNAGSIRPAEIVSFNHKSFQEFLAAWYVTHRCVPKGNLGGIEQYASALEDCEAWKNVFQFVCGLSNDGAVKVFQHLTTVREFDPTLDLSKTIPDEENETDVPLCDVTNRHERFSDLIYDSFREVQSKAELVRHWFNCTAGIVLLTAERPFPEHIPKMTLLNEIAFCKALFFYYRTYNFLISFGQWDRMSGIYESLEYIDRLHVPLRITENSVALLIGDFLRQFKTVGCKECFFNCVLRFHNGKAQFYITDLVLHCDDHARLFTETVTISTTSRSANSCSKQSCLKFLRSLERYRVVNAQPFKDLGATVIRNCKHLKTVKFYGCGDSMCELLDQIPNRSTCSLNIGNAFQPLRLVTSVGAEKLAGLLPQFNNTTTLHLELVDCCAAAVNKLVSSITHKTLKELRLRGISLTPRESVKGRFGVKGRFAPLTKRFELFPSLRILDLWNLNMDESDLHGLLESLRSIPNLTALRLLDIPLGDGRRVKSIVQQALPQVDFSYLQY